MEKPHRHYVEQKEPDREVCCQTNPLKVETPAALFRRDGGQGLQCVGGTKGSLAGVSHVLDLDSGGAYLVVQM